MAIKPDLLKKINFFQQRPWALLNVMGEIVAHGQLDSGHKAVIRQVQDKIAKGSLAEDQWLSGCYIKVLIDNGYGLLLVFDQEGEARLAVEMLLDILRATTPDGETRALSPQEIFEGLLAGSLTANELLEKRLKQSFLPQEAMHLLMLHAPQLELETFREILSALDQKILYGVVDHIGVVVTSQEDHLEVLDILRQMIQEELLLSVRLLYQVPILSFSNLKAMIEDLYGALKVCGVIKPQQDSFAYRSIAFSMAIYLGVKGRQEALQSPSALDEVMADAELLNTVQVLFKNNLNVTDTASALYVHRNTLLYRLQKIHQLTGFDLKHFEDAVNFYSILGTSSLMRLQEHL